MLRLELGNRGLFGAGHNQVRKIGMRILASHLYAKNFTPFNGLSFILAEEKSDFLLLVSHQ
jgi:hypothetical protein